MMQNDHFSKWLIFVLSIAMIIVTAGGAWADDKQYRNYVRLTTGVNEPTGDLDDAGYGSGFNIAGTYGRYLNDFLVLEGAIGSFFVDKDFRGNNAFTGRYDREDVISAASLMGTVKGELTAGPVTFFGGAGVGLYIVSLDSEIDTDRLGTLDADDSDTAFGAHLMAGGQFDITDRVFVGIEGIYRWTTEFDLRDRVATIPVELEGDLEGYTLSFFGGFRF